MNSTKWQTEDTRRTHTTAGLPHAFTFSLSFSLAISFISIPDRPLAYKYTDVICNDATVHLICNNVHLENILVSNYFKALYSYSTVKLLSKHNIMQINVCVPSVFTSAKDVFFCHICVYSYFHILICILYICIAMKLKKAEWRREIV